MSHAAIGQVTISYMIPETRVSVREPILVEFALVNQSPGPVVVDLGLNRTAAFVISFSHDDGRMLASRISVGIVPPSPYFVAPDIVTRAPTFTVGAAQIYRQRLLLNNWFSFDRAGSFQVDLDMPSPIFSQEGARLTVAGGSFRTLIEVDPYDPRRLSDKCSKLLQEITNTDLANDRLEFGTALTSVEDPVAVPYLLRLLTDTIIAERRAIAMLERIGTREAVEALIVSCQHRDQGIAKMSADALQRMEHRTIDAFVKARIDAALKNIAH